jgi:hypothetical protein
MRPFGRGHAQWLCDTGCHSTRSPGQYPCSECCGYTTDRTKQYQGSQSAATKN